MDLDKLRRLLAIDPGDPLSRFALGRKLLELGQTAEAIEHLTFANHYAPDHLATYHLLSTALLDAGRPTEARAVIEAGLPRVEAVGHGMGKDLGPALRELMVRIDQH